MILGIIQARMGSLRLPGKVLKEIDGKPLLWYLYERVTLSKHIDKVVIATAKGAANLPIVEFANKYNIDCFPGSEQDLVDRLYKTAKKFSAEIIIRITGDCPLIDYRVVDKGIKFYLDNRDRYDYVANTIKPTYPDGQDYDVMPVRTIEKMWNEVKDPFWREWFNSYIVEHPAVFRLANVTNDKDLSSLRWTVDYDKDFIFVEHIFNEFYSKRKDFSMNDILRFLEKNPKLSEINSQYIRNIAYDEAKKEASR